MRERILLFNVWNNNGGTNHKNAVRSVFELSLTEPLYGQNQVAAKYHYVSLKLNKEYRGLQCGKYSWDGDRSSQCLRPCGQPKSHCLDGFGGVKPLTCSE